MNRSITHIGIYPESISWHVKRQSCVFQLELQDIHLPFVGLWRSIGRYGITQFYRQTGIRQQGVIYMDKFLAQVDAMGTQCHLPDITLDTRLVYPVGGVDLHTSEVQLVHHYLLLEQRHQLNVNYHFFYISNCIFFISESYIITVFQRIDGLKRLHTLNTQSQWEDQFHVLYCNIHACRLGSIGSHALHCPVLHRWQIKQQSQQSYQQYRGKYDNCCPNSAFFLCRHGF